jgi:ubiquinone/menaquinone biosynthesis C-methylase UbiE
MSMNQAQRAVVDRIQHHVTLHEKHALEVGCGGGRMTAVLASKAASFVAIDSDKERLIQAQMTVPHVDFFVGSGECLAVADTSFDVVLFMFSLHHQNSAKALHEAYRVLKPGGRALVVEECGEGQFEQLSRVFHDERHQQEAAQQAIMTSAFHVVCREQLKTEWVFAHNDALFSGFAEQYGMTLDAARRTHINTIMGKRLETRPVIVEEILHVACLQKGDM